MPFVFRQHIVEIQRIHFDGNELNLLPSNFQLFQCDFVFVCTAITEFREIALFAIFTALIRNKCEKRFLIR